nr:hypothetical protein [Tanacetum cinerariifolium]
PSSCSTELSVPPSSTRPTKWALTWKPRPSKWSVCALAARPPDERRTDPPAGRQRHSCRPERAGKHSAERQSRRDRYLDRP